jgi:hypothetical protein
MQKGRIGFPYPRLRMGRLRFPFLKEDGKPPLFLDGEAQAVMRKPGKRCGAFLVALLLLWILPARGQTVNALRGTVTDPSGAAIPGATVRLVSGNNPARTTTTDERGGYVFTSLPPGTYQLTVEATGFQKYEQNNLPIQGNAPSTVDVKLTIIQVQQSVTVTGQTGEHCLAARARLMPDVGPGLRAIRQGKSGEYYVLKTPGPAIGIYSHDGKRIGQIPAQPGPGSSIGYGMDMDVDSGGRVYVADRSANATKIYSPDGALVRQFSVPAPISVAALPNGEIAVASLLSKHLVEVYNDRGREVRSFGNVSDSIEDGGAPNSPINRGWFSGDSSGDIYFDLAYLPDLTIRKYDRYGYAAYDITLPLDASGSQDGLSNWGVRFKPEDRVAGGGTIGATENPSQTGATSASGDTTGTVERTAGGVPAIGGGGTHEIREGGLDDAPGNRAGGFHRDGVEGPVGAVQFSRGNRTKESKPRIDAIGIDRSNQEVWAAVGGSLLHFDGEGSLVGAYCLNSANQVPVRPSAIVVEADRILLGADPFGIFDYARPDR